MRARASVAALLFVVLAGALAWRLHEPASAQSDARPLLFNEIADWCTDGRCNGVASDLSGGYVRFVLSYSGDSFTNTCDHVEIPAGIEGWAYGLPPDYAPYGDGLEAPEILPVSELTSRPDLAICELVVRRAE